jgi:hypothetical protein
LSRDLTNRQISQHSIFLVFGTKVPSISPLFLIPGLKTGVIEITYAPLKWKQSFPCGNPPDERARKQASGKFDCLSPDTWQVSGRVSNFPLALAGESADSGGCPFLGTSFGQAKEVQKSF